MWKEAGLTAGLIFVLGGGLVYLEAYNYEAYLAAWFAINATYVYWGITAENAYF